jgi:hypothetical protein
VAVIAFCRLGAARFSERAKIWFLAACSLSSCGRLSGGPSIPTFTRLRGGRATATRNRGSRRQRTVRHSRFGQLRGTQHTPRGCPIAIIGREKRCAGAAAGRSQGQDQSSAATCDLLPARSSSPWGRLMARSAIVNMNSWSKKVCSRVDGPTQQKRKNRADAQDCGWSHELGGSRPCCASDFFQKSTRGTESGHRLAAEEEAA